MVVCLDPGGQLSKSGAGATGSIQEVYAALVDDPGRNALIVEDVICALVEGRSPHLCRGMLESEVVAATDDRSERYGGGRLKGTPSRTTN